MVSTARYFDCNATTPLGAAAEKAWVNASAEAWFNPGGLYHGAVRTRVLLEEARATIADFLGCVSDSIIFTSGATEANNAFFHYLKKKRVASCSLAQSMRACGGLLKGYSLNVASGCS